jgi:hypothetical protein
VRMVILMCTINTMIRGMVDGFTFLIRGTNCLEVHSNSLRFTEIR